MQTIDRSMSAGLRLFAAQRQQGTNLCVGLDPHYGGEGFGLGLYGPFARAGHQMEFSNVVHALTGTSLFRTSPGFGINGDSSELVYLLAGLTGYFLEVIDAAWEAGIRVYKPQSAFYERFLPFGPMILHVLVEHIHELGRKSSQPYFVISDVKRGDIQSTQELYFNAYLTSGQEAIAPGLLGQFDFDTMTITTWMGQDVIVPGLPWFQAGKGAIIVTRSSNPGGTTLQDALILPNHDARISSSLLLTDEMFVELSDLVNMNPTVAEVMMWLTERYSQKADLTTDGISPLFSVIGSTLVKGGTFRKIRPSGIALVPGFGAQGGKFENAMPLLMVDGPFAGQGAIFSSSRGHNFPWQRKYGGNGSPRSLRGAMKRAIRQFRIAERQAYEQAGIKYPY